MGHFKQIENGVFLGAQPTEQDLENLKRQGVKAVIDFRLPGEVPTSNEALAKTCGMDYTNIPVNKENLSIEQIDELDRVMQQKPKPFLIYCASGTRAAMLMALTKAKQNSWSAERTFEEAKAMGFDLKRSAEFSAFVIAATRDHQNG